VDDHSSPDGHALSFVFSASVRFDSCLPVPDAATLKDSVLQVKKSAGVCGTAPRARHATRHRARTRGEQSGNKVTLAS
jgi:hypothetical protein